MKPLDRLKKFKEEIIQQKLELLEEENYYKRWKLNLTEGEIDNLLTCFFHNFLMTLRDKKDKKW